MTTRSLDSIRNAFKTPERDDGGSLPNNYFPFWNMKNDEQAIVRFLPDANEENPMGFLVEKVMHTLTINGERKSVPCLSMYGEPCPICAVSQQYYRADDKDNGKKYWKKKQYLAQALVVEDPLPADEETKETHEGKVRYLALGWQLFNIIKTAFEDGELDEVPFAYEGGTNFIIRKSAQGEYSTYTIGSKFARKSTDLDEDTIANLQLIDLSTLLPKHPGLEKVEGMLEAALNGTEYVDESKSSTKPSAATSTKDKVAAKIAAAEENSVTDSDDDAGLEDEADKILAQIRQRKGSKSQ